MKKLNRNGFSKNDFIWQPSICNFIIEDNGEIINNHIRYNFASKSCHYENAFLECITLIKTKNLPQIGIIKFKVRLNKDIPREHKNDYCRDTMSYTVMQIDYSTGDESWYQGEKKIFIIYFIQYGDKMYTVSINETTGKCIDFHEWNGVITINMKCPEGKPLYVDFYLEE